MNGRGPAVAALVLAAALLAGCGPDAAYEWVEPDRAGQAVEKTAGVRTIGVSEWDTLFVRGSVSDPDVVFPFWIAPGAEGLYAYDGSEQRLVALDGAGCTLWSLGGRGRGPGEFRSVRDLEVGPGGRVHLLDPRNRRISVVDPALHRVVREVPLQGVGHAEQFVPLDGGRWLLATMGPEGRADPLAVVDTGGRVVERLRPPVPDLASLHPIAAAVRSTTSPGGEQWAFGLAYGNGWWTGTGPTPGSDLRPFVEATPFPRLLRRGDDESFTIRIPPGTERSATAVSIANGHLHVLFGGRTRLASRVVDRYSIEHGKYVDSWLLPLPAENIAVAGDRVYLTVVRDVPEIVALSPASGRPARPAVVGTDSAAAAPVARSGCARDRSLPSTDTLLPGPVGPDRPGQPPGSAEATPTSRFSAPSGKK